MDLLLLFNTRFLFVCFDHSSSERCTMGRLDKKVIVLSAAAQGIGRAAAIVKSFNKNFPLIYFLSNHSSYVTQTDVNVADIPWYVISPVTAIWKGKSVTLNNNDYLKHVFFQINVLRKDALCIYI